MPKVLAKMDSLNIHLTRIGKSSTVAETSRHSRWKFKRELTLVLLMLGGTSSFPLMVLMHRAQPSTKPSVVRSCTLGATYDKYLAF